MGKNSESTKGMYSMRLQFFNEILVVALGELDLEMLTREAERAGVELPEFDRNFAPPYYWELGTGLHLIYLTEDSDVSVIYHEAMHLAFALFKHKELDFESSTGEELFNYVCEEIVLRIRIDIFGELESEYKTFRKLV